MPQKKDRVEPVKLPLDTKDGLRALLQVKPPAKEEKPKAGKKKPSSKAASHRNEKN